MSRPSRRVFTGGGLLAALFAPWKITRADEPESQDGPELTLKELSEQLGRLQKQYELLVHDLNARAVLDPPVGSVVAYAGVWPPIIPATGEVRAEAEIGWVLCDGRPFTDSTLEKVKITLENELGRLLGTADKPAAALPDLQGYFLRGIDAKYDDPKKMRDKDGVRTPGKEQVASTAMATAAFSYRQSAAAKCSIVFKDPKEHFTGLVAVARDIKGWEAQGAKGYAYPFISIDQMKKISDAVDVVIPDLGLSGGDPETRPINVAVHYIIKFRSAPSK